MVDTEVLGASALKRVGSSPTCGTKLKIKIKYGLRKRI